MKKDRKVGIYLRLSKEDDHLGESGSITNQRAILLDYIEKNHLEFVSEYVDDGVSGTTFDRIGFRKMIQDIERKKINMVITKDTSRLGRDHIEFGYYVERFFPEHNVRYVAVCDQIDTEYNYNDMLLFKSAYNDMYVKDISNKIRASLNIKKQNGEFVGAYAPYGYRKDEYDKHKLVIDEESAKVVREIFDLFLKGYSLSKIADILNDRKILIPSIYKNMNRGVKSSLFGLWHIRTISDILQNPTYMGTLTQGRCKKVNYKSKKRIHVPMDGWIMKESACPSIVSPIIFEMVQKLYQKNKYHAKKDNSYDLLLKGLVYCEECGHKIGFRRVSRVNKDGVCQHHYYGNCNYYLKHKKYHVCTPHSISYSSLEYEVLSKIYDLFPYIKKEIILRHLKDRKLDYYQDNLQHELICLKKELDLLKVKKDNLYIDKISNFISQDFYLLMKEKLENDEKEIIGKIDNINVSLSKKEDFSFEQYFDQLVNELKIDHFLINSFIEKITVTEERKVSIFFRIQNVTFDGISCNTVTQ